MIKPVAETATKTVAPVTQTVANVVKPVADDRGRAVPDVRRRRSTRQTVAPKT